MPVSITWSIVSAGAAVTLVDHGSASNGNITIEQTIYVNHDGSNAITGAGFYFQQKATGYSGAFAASTDFAEIKAWGDDSTANGHGGIQINMDPANNTGYNASTWDLSESTKQTAVAFTMNTGLGNTSSDVVTLDAEMGVGMTVDGEIPTATETSFLARVKVPTDEDTPGIRQVDQVLKYTFTS